MLNYLIQARNQSQHGRVHIDWVDSEIRVGENFTGTIGNLSIYPGGSFSLNANSMGFNDVALEIVEMPSFAKLPEIYDQRGKKRYPVPTSHLGKHINDNSPVEISKNALDYYQKLYEKARIKFIVQ